MDAEGEERMEHPVVSRQEWLAAREELLVKEKELTRRRDGLAAERRALPWVLVEKPYFFDGPDGRESLKDLFGGKSQLIVKHFMLAPGWQEGCVGCSFELDHIDGILVHLEERDVGFVAVSRAPYPEIEAFRKRMGWRIKWVSSAGSDFNYDFHVSFTPQEMAAGEGYYNYGVRKLGIEELSGRSVFCKDAKGEVFHTYSSYGRGGEDMLTTYRLLDLLPKGRDERGPKGNLTDWVRHHDRYGAAGVVAEGRWLPATRSTSES